MTICGKIILNLYRMVVQRIVMRNELRKLIGEHVEPTKSREFTPHHMAGNKDHVPAAERARQIQDQQSASESVLTYARFRTARHRRIYAAHVAGKTTREIGRAFGVHHLVIERTLRVYDRQARVNEAHRRLDLDLATSVSWRRYGWGRERASERPAVESVLARLRELPPEPATPDDVKALPREFRERWEAAGLSEHSTPDQVLTAARAWPELAFALRTAGIVADLVAT